jgi:hypothetical protein
MSMHIGMALPVLFIVKIVVGAFLMGAAAMVALAVATVLGVRHVRTVKVTPTFPNWKRNIAKKG